MEKIKIKCPSCSWKPTKKAMWRCECGTQFNAFAQQNQCPTCKKTWEYTQCVEEAGGCNEFAPHIDWYENVPSMVSELMNELNIPVTTPQRG